MPTATQTSTMLNTLPISEYELTKLRQLGITTLEQLITKIEMLHGEPATPLFDLPGIDPSTVEYLNSRRIFMLEQLTCRTEFEICQMFADDHRILGMDNDRIRGAITRFLELRAVLDRRGVFFAGSSHTRNELFEMF